MQSPKITQLSLYLVTWDAEVSLSSVQNSSLEDEIQILALLWQVPTPFLERFPAFCELVLSVLVRALMGINGRVKVA